MQVNKKQILRKAKTRVIIKRFLNGDVQTVVGELNNENKSFQYQYVFCNFGCWNTSHLNNK